MDSPNRYRFHVDSTVNALTVLEALSFYKVVLFNVTKK